MPRTRTRSVLALLAIALAVAALPGAAQHHHHAHDHVAAAATNPPAPGTAVPAARSAAKPLGGRILEGAPATFGNGTARTLVALGADGTPETLAVALTAGAIDGLPAEPPADDTGWLTRLPLPAGVALPPFDHVGLYWNPHGHEPHGVYDVSHFDVHFFMSRPEALDRITAIDRDLERVYRLPPAGAIPAGYLLPPNTQHRRMGIHWVDTAAAELKGEPFTATFIIGSYDSEINFLEPMITRAFLAGKPDLTRPVPQAAGHTRAGWYPTTWSVRWDAERGEYLVLLDALRWQEASLPVPAGTLAAAASEAAASGK